MFKFISNTVLVAAVIALAGCSTMTGMGSSSNAQSSSQKQAALAARAESVLQQQMTQPKSKRIPAQLVANARCIAVFPSVVQAGLIVGGRHGKGLVTCRQRSGGFENAHPAVFSLSSGSLGLQAGAQKISIVLLFNTRQSVDSLLAPKLKLGSQIAVTAGPSGYDRAITRAPAPVVAYVTSRKGLFAGIDLNGSKISFDQSANSALYGSQATPRGILLGSVPTSGAMSAFVATLQRFAPGAKSGQEQSGSSQSQPNSDQNRQQSGSETSQSSGSGASQSGMNQ